MPWLVWGGLAGIGPMLRGRLGSLPPGATRTLAVIVLGYLVFVCLLQQWRTMNGWSIGPRYLVPAMLPLAFVAGVGWQRLATWKAWLGSLTAGLAAAAMGAVAMVTAAYPSPPAELANPLSELALPLLADGFGVRNAGGWLGLGAGILVPFGLLVCLAMVWVLWPLQTGSFRQNLRRAGLALAVALIWLGWLALVRPTSEAVRERWLDFARQTVEGTRPGA